MDIGVSLLAGWQRSWPLMKLSRFRSIWLSSNLSTMEDRRAQNSVNWAPQTGAREYWGEILWRSYTSGPSGTRVHAFTCKSHALIRCFSRMGTCIRAQTFCSWNGHFRRRNSKSASSVGYLQKIFVRNHRIVTWSASSWAQRHPNPGYCDSQSLFHTPILPLNPCILPNRHVLAQVKSGRTRARKRKDSDVIDAGTPPRTLKTRNSSWWPNLSKQSASLRIFSHAFRILLFGVFVRSSLCWISTVEAAFYTRFSLPVHALCQADAFQPHLPDFQWPSGLGVPICSGFPRNSYRFRVLQISVFTKITGDFGQKPPSYPVSYAVSGAFAPNFRLAPTRARVLPLRDWSSFSLHRRGRQGLPHRLPGKSSCRFRPEFSPKPLESLSIDLCHFLQSSNPRNSWRERGTHPSPRTRPDWALPSGHRFSWKLSLALFLGQDMGEFWSNDRPWSAYHLSNDIKATLGRSVGCCDNPVHEISR